MIDSTVLKQRTKCYCCQQPDKAIIRICVSKKLTSTYDVCEECTLDLLKAYNAIKVLIDAGVLNEV